MRGTVVPYLFIMVFLAPSLRDVAYSTTLRELGPSFRCWRTHFILSMIKSVLICFLLAMSTFGFSQGKEKVTVKGGTVITLAATNNVRASQVNVGDMVTFKLVQDVKVDEKVAIPAGTLAYGKVTEAKRSTCFGTKGRLGIHVSNLRLANGDSVLLSGTNVNISGKNRTPLSVVIFCFTCLPFPCGSKAEMPSGYGFEAMIANSTDIIVE